jgi:hypothetical protein
MMLLQRLGADYLASAALNGAADVAAPEYLVEASSLTLHAQDSVEITFVAAPGATVAQGAAVFKYRIANSRASRTWCAPVDMKIVWSAANKTGPFSGAGIVLTWSPSARQKTASDHEAVLLTDQRLLTQALHQQLAEENLERRLSRQLIAALTLAGCGLAAAALWRNAGLLPWLYGASAVGLAVLGNKRRQRLVALRASIRYSLGRINELNRSILAAQEALTTLRQGMAHKLALLQEMVALFERQALSLTAVSMPVSSLRTARAGDWVIVALTSVDDYAASFGAVVRRYDAPLLPAQERKLSLFRVAGRDGGTITLDRRSAYLPQPRA